MRDNELGVPHLLIALTLGTSFPLPHTRSLPLSGWSVVAFVSPSLSLSLVISLTRCLSHSLSLSLVLTPALSLSLVLSLTPSFPHSLDLTRALIHSLVRALSLLL